MDRTRLGLALITASAVSFGGVAVLGKLALGAGMSVPALLFWRWAIAAAALAPVLLALRGRLHGPPLTRRGAFSGLALGFAGYAGTSGVYFASLPHLPAAVASFLLYLSPVFVTVLSAVVLRESLTRRGYAALATALVGLTLLTFAPDERVTVLGAALALGSAVAYALTIVTGRRLVASVEPFRLAGLAMVGAALAFAVAAVATGTFAPPPTPEAWMHVALLGVVSTALSVSLFYLALPLIGAPRAALVSTLEPVSTALLSWPVLGESIGAVQIGGAALILAAVVLIATEAR